jgi:hypothetical protein
MSQRDKVVVSAVVAAAAGAGVLLVNRGAARKMVVVVTSEVDPMSAYPPVGDTGIALPAKRTT